MQPVFWRLGKHDQNTDFKYDKKALWAWYRGFWRLENRPKGRKQFYQLMVARAKAPVWKCSFHQYPVLHYLMKRIPLTGLRFILSENIMSLMNLN